MRFARPPAARVPALSTRQPAACVCPRAALAQRRHPFEVAADPPAASDNWPQLAAADEDGPGVVEAPSLPSARRGDSSPTRQGGAVGFPRAQAPAAGANASADRKHPRQFAKPKAGSGIFEHRGPNNVADCVPEHPKQFAEPKAGSGIFEHRGPTNIADCVPEHPEQFAEPKVLQARAQPLSLQVLLRGGSLRPSGWSLRS